MLLHRYPLSQAKIIPIKLLAHIGDAVFHLFEREREILVVQSAKELHERTISRTSAAGQANLLSLISTKLTTEEADLVRRAYNLKFSGPRKSSQRTYRKATAFEALLGYLYLTDINRLRLILSWTTTSTPPPSCVADP